MGCGVVFVYWLVFYEFNNFEWHLGRNMPAPRDTTPLRNGSWKINMLVDIALSQCLFTCTFGQ